MLWKWVEEVQAETSSQFFRRNTKEFIGAVIDGNHDAPHPLEDVQGAAHAAADVILLHDHVGRPVREAGDWLVSQGFKHRIYFTPNGVGLFWRGLPDFVPPDHIPDPLCEQSMRARIEQDGGTL
jgi:hypothetical protein